MRRLFIILLVICISGTFASSQNIKKVKKQGKSKREELYQKTQNVIDSLKNADSRIFFVEVGKLNIKDKIFLSNKSSYYIQNAMVGFINETAKLEIVAVTSNISPGQQIELASFNDNELKKIKNRTLVMKVKGSKGPISNQGNDASQSELTYNFKASLSENRHDLYIDITRQGGDEILDF